MSLLRTVAVVVALFLSGVPVAAAEWGVTSKVVAVDLFKNGLVVVKREVTLGKPGTYALDDVPSPVHGTYWVESGGPVETVVAMREVDVPAAEAAPGNPQDDFAGKRVTVSFKGDRRPPVVGTMLKLKPAKDADAAARYLVVQTARGRSYIEPTEVSSVEGEDVGDKVTRRRPRLLLTLGETDKAETKVTIRYLTHGLSWAASYRIDITDPKTLTLEQHAIVRNELGDVAGAEVRLISGYPSVEFAHVRSPLSPHTTWASFFRELSNGGGREINLTGNSAVTQQTAFNNFRGSVDLALGATPTGEGVDLHYQPIGRRTLAENATLALTVARGKADYERIVEWAVADSRDDYGRLASRAAGGGGHDDDAWDALKFKNPLSFPMTTGPATVTADGKFNGQRTSYFVNAGEETLLRVGKALSVRTRATEHEQVAKDGGSGRDVVWIGGRQYRRATVQGELAIANHRKEGIQTVIRRRMSGELVQAEGTPRTALLEEGVFSVNKRNELVWTLALKAGEEKKLKYTYTVLVPN